MSVDDDGGGDGGEMESATGGVVGKGRATWSRAEAADGRDAKELVWVRHCATADVDSEDVATDDKEDDADTAGDDVKGFLNGLGRLRTCPCGERIFANGNTGSVPYTQRCKAATDDERASRQSNEGRLAKADAVGDAMVPAPPLLSPSLDAGAR
jgi:hypothetical protein